MTQALVRVGFIGGGRVTRVLTVGWRRAGALPPTILVNEPDDEAFAQLSVACPEVRRVTMEEAAAADVLFVALHPPAFGAMMPAMRPSLSQRTIVVSLAPKITLDALAAAAGTSRVARMIPNAPSIIGRGFNPVAFGSGLDAGARHDLAAAFAPWGACPEVAEADLEAYAVLTAMGPTYFWFQWQVLRDLAGQFGLTPECADGAIRQMLDGATATLLDSGLPASDVLDLIPVRPLQGIEASVTASYTEALPAVLAKIRPLR